MPRYKKSLCKQPASSDIKAVIWTISAHATIQLSRQYYVAKTPVKQPFFTKGSDHASKKCIEAMKLPDFSTSITGRAEVSFVMLYWSMPTKVVAMVRKALNFTNIINEVTIWNNDVNSFPSDNLPKIQPSSHPNRGFRKKYH
jgi:hypothetical protein